MLERSEEQFPELPMQWRDHGYEIDQRLGKGAYGAVYRLVKNRGAENEEFSALKVISWELGTEQIREYDNDLEKARRNFSRLFNKAVNEVSILESLAGEAHIVQLKGSCIEKMPEENYCRLYIQMEYLTDLLSFMDQEGPLDENRSHSAWELSCAEHWKYVIGRESCIGILNRAIFLYQGRRIKLGDSAWPENGWMRP